MILFSNWTNLLKECLLNPKDLKEDNAFEVFKILHQNSKDISPDYAIICAKNAAIEAMRIKKDPDQYSEFNLNAFIFKTKITRFIEEKSGNPVPE